MRPCRPGLVSTVIPVRNRPALLVEAVQSVLAQTYRPIEIIVVDDGSIDATPEVARTLAIQHPGEVQFIQQQATGVASARNAGLNAASGEYVQLLDSDDLLMPEKFARQVAGLRAAADCGISYCRTREYALDGRWSAAPARRTGESLPYLFPHLLMGRVWAAPSPLYRREVIEQSGPMHELAIYEDWEYEGRAASRSVRLHHCDEYLADKRDTQHLVGGQKGGTRPHKLKDYAAIHHRMHAYASAAGVPAADLGRFAAKIFAAARVCAADGFEDEARGLVQLATRLAIRPSLRLWLALHRQASNQFGWRTVARWSRSAERSAPVVVLRRAAAWPVAFVRLWRHRLDEARTATSGRSMATWPQLLAARWAARQSRPRLR